MNPAMHRWQRAALMIVSLAVAGAVLNSLSGPVWNRLRSENGVSLKSTGSAAVAGQGVSLALLGGFRSLVADALWLRLYTHWERQDIAGTQTYIELTTSADPRPLTFWINGARMLGYDLPVWRIMREGGYDAVTPARQTQITREQAALGLSLLARGEAFHPHSADLWIERANLQQNGLHDTAAAAESYRQAWAQPNAPYYAARLYGELLRRMNRKREALDWLKQLHPMLPADDESAGADIVLGRIRSLERELNVPPLATYEPPKRTR